MNVVSFSWCFSNVEILEKIKCLIHLLRFIELIDFITNTLNGNGSYIMEVILNRKMSRFSFLSVVELI